MFEDEMLTIDDLATYLKLRPQTIYKWAQAKKIPGAKFGKEWRFRRSTIEKWIDSQISVSGESRPGGAERAQPVTPPPETQALPDRAAVPEREVPPERKGRVVEPVRPSRETRQVRAETAKDRTADKSEPTAPHKEASRHEGPRVGTDHLSPPRYRAAADTAQRAAASTGSSTPVEKLAGSKKGARSGRRTGGPESN